MQAKAIAARAEQYACADGLSAADALLATLIDLFTVRGADQPAAPDEVRAAWERLCRRLDERTRLHEHLTLMEGTEVLAANLHEAGDVDGAATVRGLFPPLPHVAPETEAEPVPSFAPDGPLWVSQPAL